MFPYGTALDRPAIDTEWSRAGVIQWSRRGAWLAIFAILLQALLPVVHHPADMALAGTLGFAGAHNLCIAPGGAPVQPAVPDKAPHDHLPACPICQAIHRSAEHPIEGVGAKLRATMPWIAENKLVDKTKN